MKKTSPKKRKPKVHSYEWWLNIYRNYEDKHQRALHACRTRLQEVTMKVVKDFLFFTIAIPAAVITAVPLAIGAFMFCVYVSAFINSFGGS